MSDIDKALSELWEIDGYEILANAGRAELEEYRASLSTVKAENEALRAQIAELKALLKESEWQGERGIGDEACCWMCGTLMGGGHADDCRLAKALEEK